MLLLASLPACSGLFGTESVEESAHAVFLTRPDCPYVVTNETQRSFAVLTPQDGFALKQGDLLLGNLRTGTMTLDVVPFGTPNRSPDRAVRGRRPRPLARRGASVLLRLLPAPARCDSARHARPPARTRGCPARRAARYFQHVLASLRGPAHPAAGYSRLLFSLSDPPTLWNAPSPSSSPTPSQGGHAGKIIDRILAGGLRHPRDEARPAHARPRPRASTPSTPSARSSAS